MCSSRWPSRYLETPQVYPSLNQTTRGHWMNAVTTHPIIIKATTARYECERSSFWTLSLSILAVCLCRNGTMIYHILSEFVQVLNFQVQKGQSGNKINALLGTYDEIHSVTSFLVHCAPTLTGAAPDSQQGASRRNAGWGKGAGRPDVCPICTNQCARPLS